MISITAYPPIGTDKPPQTSARNSAENPAKDTSNQPKKKPIWLSPSSVNAYLRCPRSFYLSRIAKAKQKPSIHLIRGIAVHNAIGQFYRHRLNRCANIALSELRPAVVALFVDEWNRHKESLSTLRLTDEDLDFFVYDSKKMMLNFLHDFIKAKGFEQPAPDIEKMLFANQYRLLGRIDAIHSGRSPSLLVDFKTSKSKEFSEDYKRQLAIYSILYQNHYREKPEVAIHYLKFPDGLETYPISDQYIDETIALVKDIHTKIQSQDIADYPCTCGWCERNFYPQKNPNCNPNQTGI